MEDKNRKVDGNREECLQKEKTRDFIKLDGSSSIISTSGVNVPINTHTPGYL